ncbi:MAG: endo-1,4-beta-xylanase [Firmicutes bacterium]|nr:endo-1,4-beta-xylanase [Bacillota bacterium]
MEVHVTEWDMSVYNNCSDKWETVSDQILSRQAIGYQDLFRVFVRNKDTVRYVALCGVSDDLTWLRWFFVERNDWPLLFDEQLKPKPAFWGTVAAASGTDQNWAKVRADYLGH